MKPLKIAIFIAVLALSATGLYFAYNRPQTPYSFSLETQVLNFAAKFPSQDCLIVSKSKHLVYYCQNGFIVRSAAYKGFNITFPAPVAIGMGGQYETPSGEYYICQKNPESRYTLFLGISWPSIADANNAIELGQHLSVSDYRRIIAANVLRQTPPWDTPLGGTYGIHGAPTYMKYAVDSMERRDPDIITVTKRDNTRGCVAVEHRVLRYLYANVDEGTPILILN